jgi:hypothetical protein
MKWQTSRGGVEIVTFSMDVFVGMDVDVRGK